MKELGFFVLIVIVVWIIWFAGGGPERFNPRNGLFLEGRRSPTIWNDFRY